MRADGLKVGYARPVTLFPFPSAALAEVAGRVQALAVYENNQGQMIDDVRLAVLGAAPVHFIGVLSIDSSGFGIAPDLDVATIRRRVERVLADATSPPGGLP
jgi:2-oxoglutarate/2-oxoacid ferredoxin oxidoreductase subunit alpha